MAFTPEEVASIYRKRASWYDIACNLFYLIGFRQWTFRRQAVAALNLNNGDTVVEIACGTGLNFGLLEERIGAEGKIIGVDMTDAMLAQAEKRTRQAGWKNVELVHCEASKYEFPENIDGIISTFALTLVPAFDDVIRRGAQALPEGQRWVVADFRLPDDWRALFTPLLLPLFRPFVSKRYPWKSIERYMDEPSFETAFLGYVYIASGRARLN
jgi:demethylmenaquinone methyltransferase/2-methoxy-6-polyprenyl-1,4-benzoquinol methylase